MADSAAAIRSALGVQAERRTTRPALVALAHRRLRLQPAFDAYVRWRETALPAAFDEALEQALAIIGPVVIAVRAATADEVVGLDEDDLVSVAAIALSRKLADTDYVVEGPGEFYRLLRRVARRAMLVAVRENRARLYDYGARCTTPPRARLLSTHDMEFRIFLERLPRTLFRQTRAVIVTSLRLVGDTERAVSLHVLVRLLSGRLLLKPELLAGHFGVTESRARFLIDWTTVTLRRQLYALRDAHDGTVLGDWHDLADLYEPEISAAAAD